MPSRVNVYQTNLAYLNVCRLSAASVHSTCLVFRDLVLCYSAGLNFHSRHPEPLMNWIHKALASRIPTVTNSITGFIPPFLRFEKLLLYLLPGKERAYGVWENYHDRIMLSCTVKSGIC